MSDASIRDYLRQWETVAEIEKQERQNASMATRWQQLNMLYGMGKALGLLQANEKDKQVVMNRWLKLKNKEA